MIQYTLKCEQEHTFDSWFQSSSAFEKLKASKMVVCSICGSSKIDKAIMAPRVNKNNKISVKKKKHPAEQAIAEIKKHLDKNAKNNATSISFTTKTPTIKKLEIDTSLS